MNTDHRQLWTILGVLVVVVLLGSVLVGGTMGPGMMWGYGWHGSGWLWGLGMGLGALVMLAFWGALIAGGILLMRWLLGYTHAGDNRGGEDPLAVLRRRYAAGEIDQDAAGEIDQATYDRMVRDLTGTTPTASDLTYSARSTDGQGEEKPVLSTVGREPQKEPDRPER
jgi:putative membrane protein